MSAIFILFRLSWIGLCAVSMLAATRLLFPEAHAFGSLDGFVFGATVFAYYFSHPRPLIRYSAWSTGAIALFFFLYLHVPTQLAVLLPGIIWASYYGWRRPSKAGLRMIPILKPLAIAFAWTWVTVLLPLDPGHWYPAGLLVLGRAAFIFGLALAYDLDDRAYDLQRGLQTLAGVRGQARTFRLIYLALIIAGMCALGNYGLQRISLHALYAVSCSYILSALALPLFFSIPQLSAYRKILIDGLMILQWLLLAIF